MSGRKIYLALYKGHRAGTGWRVWAARLTDRLTRKLTRGQYSHCEIAVDIGGGKYECYSASVRDGGVRSKTMPLPKGKWDLIPLPGLNEDKVRIFFKETCHRPYDLWGALGVVFKFRQRGKQWFCSEWCAQTIGLPEGWRFSPNDLAAVFRKEELWR